MEEKQGRSSMIAGSPGRSWTPWPSTQRLSASKPTGAASSLSVPRPPGLLAVLSPSRAFSLVSAVIQSRAQRGCAIASEMSKRSEGPSAARVCERQRDVEAPVSCTVRGCFVSL